jgi:mono/diheme cytochrome c family protein
MASRVQCLVAAAALSFTLLADSAVAQTDAAADGVQRGEYLARAGDCVACHTAPGGQAYAGGLVIETPFGGIASPNITPDKATGIGGWSDDEFYRAMHDGLGRKGEFLYPAFPFTSFTKVTKEDALAIKAYLFSLAPVSAPRQPNTLRFPFNIRQSLLVWRELFFRPGTFEPNAAASSQVNRGAYLVEGLAHCGECHTPRNVLGGAETSQKLAGAEIAGWVAPNVSSDVRQGIGDWTNDQLVSFLKTGAAPQGVVFGPMADVVHDSLRYLTDEDIRAMVAYLRTTPTRSEPAAPATDQSKLEGATLYLNNCAQCHQALGVGMPGSIPSLSGNAAVAAPAPNDVIMAILGGLPGSGNYGAMPSFAAALDDREVAELTNYVRTAWANHATANATPALVASLRGQATVSSAATEASMAFGCPRIPTTGGPATLPDASSGVYDILAGANAGTIDNRVNEIIAALRRQNTDPDLVVDTLYAAYCPVIAADTGLTSAQKKSRLDDFRQQVTRLVFPDAQSPASDILVQVPVKPDVLQKLDQAASGAQLSRDAWIARLIQNNLRATP